MACLKAKAPYAESRFRRFSAALVSAVFGAAGSAPDPSQNLKPSAVPAPAEL